MKFFLNTEMMKESILSLNVNVNKMPLGTLSKETVFKAYEILRNIEKAIKSTVTVEADLMELSSQFFTLIPHNIGRQKMSQFMIRTME